MSNCYNLPKDQARHKLLGEQWFVGRTGYNKGMSTPKNNEEIKFDD